jgi:hypothetical protein
MNTDTKIKRIARALWVLDCEEKDLEYRMDCREPPAQWADPWAPHGGGQRQARKYEEKARAILAAIEPAEENRQAAIKIASKALLGVAAPDFAVNLAEDVIEAYEAAIKP